MEARPQCVASRGLPFTVTVFRIRSRSYFCPLKEIRSIRGRRSQVGVGRKQELMLSRVGGPVRCREGAGATAVLGRRSGGAGGA